MRIFFACGAKSLCAIRVIMPMAMIMHIRKPKPFRHEPMIPAIFCSCGLFPQPLVSLPIQLAR
ncbi:MAG TPA: hypothetical protein DE060_20865, partial [Lentisphaeria bacterium]|nr:hypothetical protein [Lentisphaeria bacterium]